jgi:hypothetical protein
MPGSPLTRPSAYALSGFGIRALRSPPPDDDADEDDWEAIEPDPTELDDWDEPLSDDDLEYGADEDEDEGEDADDGWRGDEWPDFDRADDDD